MRDVGVAEDLAQEALVAALEQWPESGVPDNPGAWLMATAKHRAIDRMRRAEVHERKTQELGRELERAAETPSAATSPRPIDDPFDDDLLRLIFTACHPVLSTEARVALTLRLLGGLTTEEIARAFLVPEATVAQRIVRAKRTLVGGARAVRGAARATSCRRGSPRCSRSIYLIFNEGYAATAGDDWIRPELCEEALRLGRILAELLPREPEVHGLVALMELQASRARARVGPDGRADPAARAGPLALGLAARRPRAGGAGRGRERLGGALGPTRCRPRSPPATPARATPAETDWERIVALYDALAAARRRSPVVELNRAVAVGMAFGPEAGLELVDALADEPALRGYHLLPARARRPARRARPPRRGARRVRARRFAERGTLARARHSWRGRQGSIRGSGCAGTRRKGPHRRSAGCRRRRPANTQNDAMCPTIQGKFMPKKPVMKPSGRKIVAMSVSCLLVSFCCTLICSGGRPARRGWPPGCWSAARAGS